MGEQTENNCVWQETKWNPRQPQRLIIWIGIQLSILFAKIASNHQVYCSSINVNRRRIRQLIVNRRQTVRKQGGQFLNHLSYMQGLMYAPTDRWTDRIMQTTSQPFVLYADGSHNVVVFFGYIMPYSAGLLQLPWSNIVIVSLKQSRRTRIYMSREFTTNATINQSTTKTLRWRHNGRYSVSNHQPHDCLLKRLFGRRSK